MTKADLIAGVSQAVEMTRKDSEIIVETIFRTRQRQPRIGRNPKTGARVEVPSKTVAYFKPSKELKKMINPTKPELQQEPSVTLSQT